MNKLEIKLEALKAWFAAQESVAVAYSAGVDSTLLLAVAHEVLGENVLAITANSPAYPDAEVSEARAFCQQRGIRQVVFETNELEIEGFDHNPENRCYLCKNELFTDMLRIAQEHGISVVAEGSNMNDLGDYRPGRQALGELGIASPLLEAGLTKEEIRELSRQMDLPTAEKQSFACLYSRFAYGDLITRSKLAMVDAGEQVLKGLGFSTFRVRLVGEDVARIEVRPEEFELAMQPENRQRIVDGLKEAGFAYVALDLQGYRTGSMNETL